MVKGTTKNLKQKKHVVIDCGALSDMTWPGTVSARSMIEKGNTSKKIIDHAFERLDEFYVPVHNGAKTRCIDGRHDPKLDEAYLGPQVPGGAPGAALAYRLGVDEDDLTRGTFLTDAEAMVGNYIRLGFAPGGHRDEHSDGSSSVGCGAIDGMDAILCSIDLKNKILHAACANNPLWLARNGEIQELAPDKMPVGLHDNMATSFTKQTVQLQEGDIIYIFTDGYADQFGGPKNKKFRYKQLEELLLSINDRSMPDQKQILDKTIEDWKGTCEQVDDILVIGIRIT